MIFLRVLWGFSPNCITANKSARLEFYSPLLFPWKKVSTNRNQSKQNAGIVLCWQLIHLQQLISAFTNIEFKYYREIAALIRKQTFTITKNRNTINEHDFLFGLLSSKLINAPKTINRTTKMM